MAVAKHFEVRYLQRVERPARHYFVAVSIPDVNFDARVALVYGQILRHNLGKISIIPPHYAYSGALFNII